MQSHELLFCDIHIHIHSNYVKIQTPISNTIASIMLPITVMKSNKFHASLKKFCDPSIDDD